MIESFPVKPRSTHVPEFHPINHKKLLKRARKAKVWNKSVSEARKDFTEYEILWLRSYYLVDTEDARRRTRRRGKVWEMPRLLKD